MTNAVKRYDESEGPIVAASDAPMVAMIERIAMDPTVPLDRLERMLEMKDKMDRQAAERAFAAAFASASSLFPAIPLNGTGNNKTKYALLKDIISCTRPVLAAHGLVLSFDVQTTEKSVKVSAVLSHKDGHSRSTSLSLPTDSSGSKNAVQAFGSTQTYGQRYTAQALLGLSLGEDSDDDGKASGAGSTISEAQFREIRDLIEKSGGDESKLVALYGVDKLVELPAVNFGAATAMLRKKIAQKGGAQ